MSASVARLAPAAHHDAPAQPACGRPFVGIAAVLLGAIISTLYTRITTFGLADLRGAVHAGFDQGAWITTAGTVGQMCVGPLAAWFGLVFGVRRVLVISASVFALASGLIPLSPDLPSLLIGQAIAGLSSGTFIPLTIGFVVQSLPPPLWPYGIAAYGLNLELSLNIPASLEGWYLDYFTWHWIFWQGTLLAIPMLICVHFGMPKRPINREALRNADGWGMFYAAAGFSMLYAALDQGNRLDWLNSGLICGLLLGSAVLIAAFILQALFAEHSWINLRFVLQRNIALLMTILVLYRFIILSTSYLIPQYLTTIQNFRSLEVGKVLLWIAVPQFLLAPLIATVLRWIDPRIMLAMGICAVGIACAMASADHPGLGDGRFPAVAGASGVRAIGGADRNRAVCGSASAAGRCHHVRRAAADGAFARRGVRQRVHADLCPRSRAGGVKLAGTVCAVWRNAGGGAP